MTTAQRMAPILWQHQRGDVAYTCNHFVRGLSEPWIVIFEEIQMDSDQDIFNSPGLIEDAVRYSLNQKQQLMAFLDHGDVPISNNLAENAIRPFVVGRKNWLFCDSVKGAESSAIVYSLVETAKANGIEPYEYLLLVLTMLPYLGKSPAHEELEKLMPWHPAVRHREHIRK